MDGKMKKTSERFPLRLPIEMDAEIRKLARGDGSHPPAGINETILFLIREGLKSIKSETKPGQFPPARLEAVTA